MEIDPFILTWLIGLAWAMLYSRSRYERSRLAREISDYLRGRNDD